MKIIFLKSVDSIGLAGEVKDVKSGFARNFLLPKKLAVIASPENLKIWQKQIKQRQSKQAKQATVPVEAAVKSLEGKTITFKSKADDKGNLYASISKDKIRQALQDLGFSVKARNIVLDKPLKAVGSYNVTVKTNDQTNRIQVVVKA